MKEKYSNIRVDFIDRNGGGIIIKTQILKKEGFYEKTISLLLVSFLLITNV